MVTIYKPVAAFDIDGTLFRGNLVSQLCEELCRCGYFSGLFAQNMMDLFVQRDRRQLPYRMYEQKLVNLLLVALRGKSQSQLMNVAHFIAANAVDKCFVFTSTLLNAVHNTHDCVAVTGGLQEIANAVADHWGFDACYSSVLEVKDDLYTGQVLAKPVRNKSRAIRLHLNDVCTSTLECSIGIGDTISDESLLELVERPIAFNPDAALTARAEAEQWPIVYERKDVICVLQHGAYQRFSTDDAMQVVRALTTECRELQ